MRRLIPLFLLPFAFQLTGCAAITASQTTLFDVASNPPGADVRLNGQVVGTTPTRIEVPRRGSALSVEIAMEGYATHTCPVHKFAGAGWVIGDVAFCALLFPLGCIAFIDGNGAWNDLDASSCNASLVPLRGSTPVAEKRVEERAKPAALKSVTFEAPRKAAGCSMDSDCKGDRICESGRCVSPNAEGESSAARQTSGRRAFTGR